MKLFKEWFSYTYYDNADQFESVILTKEQQQMKYINNLTLSESASYAGLDWNTSTTAYGVFNNDSVFIIGEFKNQMANGQVKVSLKSNSTFGFYSGTMVNNTIDGEGVLTPTNCYYSYCKIKQYIINGTTYANKAYYQMLQMLNKLPSAWANNAKMAALYKKNPSGDFVEELRFNNRIGNWD